MVTIGFAGIAAGAVYRPAALMLPAVADHVTPVLFVPVTVAENCVVADKAEVWDCGDTVTVIGAGGAVVTVMFTGWLITPPGSGCATVTANVPACGKSPTAVSVVGLT